MSYLKHFSLADDYIKHTDEYVLGLTDPFIKSKFTGFLAVSAVTVYELSVKTIFIEFSKKKHHVFGSFVESRYDSLNGQIGIDRLENYAGQFGEKYKIKFRNSINDAENSKLQSARASIKSSYGNLLRWRHDFSHKGIIPQNASYEEAKRAYELGKLVIECLDESMMR